MKYIKPLITMNVAQAAMMIAESLRIVGGDEKTVDGDKALTKEDNAWDIWSDE